MTVVIRGRAIQLARWPDGCYRWWNWHLSPTLGETTIQAMVTEIYYRVMKPR